jgi:hypothetical protein
MTRRTRWFLVGSALIVVMGLCTGLVAYYNGSLPLFSAGPGPAELAYVPETATIVAYANVGEIMKSDLRKRLQAVLPAGQGKNQLQAETGVDLEHDIDTVVAGFGIAAPAATAGSSETPETTKTSPGQNAVERTVVLIRGRFDQPHIEALLKEHGGTIEDYKGKHVLEEGTDSPMSQMGHVSGAVAFLEPGLIALGSVQAVREAIDTRGDGRSVRKNADLMKFVADLDPASNAWVTGRLDAVTKNANVPAVAKERLAAVQWFSLSARVDGGMSGILRAEARDAQSGEDLRSVVRGGLAAARLMGGQNSKLDVAINSLQLSGSGKDLALSFTLPPDLLDMANGIAGLKNLTSGKH